MSWQTLYDEGLLNCDQKLSSPNCVQRQPLILLLQNSAYHQNMSLTQPIRRRKEAQQALGQGRRCR